MIPRFIILSCLRVIGFICSIGSKAVEYLLNALPLGFAPLLPPGKFCRCCCCCDEEVEEEGEDITARKAFVKASCSMFLGIGSRKLEIPPNASISCSCSGIVVVGAVVASVRGSAACWSVPAAAISLRGSGIRELPCMLNKGDECSGPSTESNLKDEDEEGGLGCCSISRGNSCTATWLDTSSGSKVHSNVSALSWKRNIEQI